MNSGSLHTRTFRQYTYPFLDTDELKMALRARFRVIWETGPGLGIKYSSLCLSPTAITGVIRESSFNMTRGGGGFIEGKL